MQDRDIHRFARTAAALVAAWGMLLGGPLFGDAPVRVDFARDVRPILSNYCFQCHGPDEGTREAGLRLDTPDGAQQDLGGYRAVEPHQPQQSALIERIETDDVDLRMPPEDSGLQLSPQQIDVLRQWVAQGAAYEQHWAFRPVARPPIPAPDAADGNAHAAESPVAQNPVDAFIQRSLRTAGLNLSPQADRPTLIRRVYLDLLGLPPSPAAVREFITDSRPQAFEAMLDRVLADPHYGERWGRHWLDQARYADTNGYTVDSARSIWPYRDWVIQAVNADMPVDQFTIEQLAGDLLPSPTQSQLVATGFHRNTLVNQEGGSDPEQFRNEAVIDRVNTTGAVWLGLTVGCAQCHTHKFDPLTQHEYFQLFAFFNSGQDVNSTSPTLPIATPEQRQRLAQWDREIAAAKAALAAFDAAREQALPEDQRDRGGPLKWTVADVQQAVSDAGASLQRLDDGSWLAGGNHGDSDRYTLTFPAPAGRITGLRLETLTHPSLPQGGPGRAGNGNFVLGEVTLAASGDNVDWLHAAADHSQDGYDVTQAIDGDPATGWAINVASGRLNTARTARFVCAAKPVEPGAPVSVTLAFPGRPAGYSIGRFRLAVTDAAHAKLDVPDAERSKLVAEVDRLQKAKQQYAKDLPTTMVMRDLKTPRDTHLLIRGDFLRPGDRVQPDVPAVLPPLPPSDQPRTRLDLARWLVDRENPLVARVLVNRSWMRLFGRGLVETENDFGLQGTPPTHPELLDWLAAELIDQGWSMKHLHRTILSSATYRQSSRARDDAAAIDPLNKLLARQSRLRVEAEVVRDLAIAASGMMDSRIGGPSVYPPQPDGVYAFTQRNASWPTSTDGDRYRRGMYTFFMRSAPHPMLTTFDTPRFNTTCTRRARSNTPLQSLTIANDQAMLEAARGLAERIMSVPGDDAEHLELAYRICFSRSPKPPEAQRLRQYLTDVRQAFADAPQDARALVAQTTGVADGQAAAADAPADLAEGSTPSETTTELATWTAVSRVMLNLDEFITRE